MDSAVEFLIVHGYIVLFVFVFAEQLGVPLPSIPFLLAAGALTRAGSLDLTVTITIAVVAALASDVAWYEVGRRRGGMVLGWLCRLSLEPDSCVRKTQGMFARHGSSSLLIAKFVPGLTTVAPPLAGVLRMPPLRFLLFDTLGALLWAGLFITAGYVLSEQIGVVARWLSQLGLTIGVVLGIPLLAYLGWKLHERRRALGELTVARISAAELAGRMKREHPPVVVDLRHRSEHEVDPVSIPGAISIPIEDLDKRHHEIPRDGEIIVFCT